MDHTGYSRIEIISSSKDASRKNREVTQADTARNTAESVFDRCVIGFAGVTPICVFACATGQSRKRSEITSAVGLLLGATRKTYAHTEPYRFAE